MTRLQSIENSLSSINPAVFQELCDSFLAVRNKNYSAFSRSGSQVGKQKTIKGTPDTFILLPNGKYIFVEYSTNSTAGLAKLKEDVTKCIDSDKTGIPVNQISEIIICVNFRLKLNEAQILRALLNDTRIKLTIYDLDRIAIELHLHHRNLVHDYLGLPLDTGQIVSIEKFIDEYDKNASKGISTTLSNTFLNRKAEFKIFNDALSSNDIIIITGDPGVGKTRFGLEAIRDFLSKNLEYNAYCVSYKHYTLLEDLQQYFDSDHNFILFVDDANRIDHFSQITSFLKGKERGKLKVVFTVRKYALRDIKILCQDFNLMQIDIGNFSDAEIVEILEQKPFLIRNQVYHNEILRIAGGNPRLAIMVARLAIEEQNIDALYDVSELFEIYFSTFVQDDKALVNKLQIKCLGLIAFFHAIPHKDRSITDSILSKFQMPYQSFIEIIDELDRMEIVEIHYEHVKIPEQNLAIYFFYRAFVKGNLLSFETILKNYYETKRDRFIDCVVSTNNSFNPNRVKQKFQPILRNYWKGLRKDEKKRFNFLSAFWFYLSDEIFDSVDTIIDKLPQDFSEEYNVNYDNNEFAFNRNEVLNILEKFFDYGTKSIGNIDQLKKDLRTALELAFYFVCKKPEHLAELIYSLRAKLTFDRDDEQSDFERQKILFEILIGGLDKSKKVHSLAFYELSKTFLEYNFYHTKSEGNQLVSYIYSLDSHEGLANVTKIRETIWLAVNDHFPNYSNQSIELLENYTKIGRKEAKNIIESDVPFVLSIITNHLKIEKFQHCKYVQDQICWFKAHSINRPEFENLQKTYTNSTYETYLIIDWYRYNDKNSHEFSDINEYDRQKESEIRNSLLFHDVETVLDFLDDFTYLKNKAKNDWGYIKSLEIVIDENYKQNPKIGLAILKKIVESKNQINYLPQLVLKNHLKSKDTIELIWGVLQIDNFNRKAEWELSFYELMDEKFLNSNYVEKLIETISGMEGTNRINLDRFQKFLSSQPDIFEIILEKIVSKNERGSKLTLCPDIFTTYFDKFGDNIELLKKAYQQQYKIQNSFDHGGKGLLNILNKDAHFLIEHTLSLFSERRREFQDDFRQLGFVWTIPKIDSVLNQIFDLVASKTFYLGSSKHFCNTFFAEIPTGYSGMAKEFLFEYVRSNYSNSGKMNIVVDVVRNSMKEIFEDILLLFLSLNKNKGIFSKIFWIGNFSLYSGDVIVGNIRATKWEEILSIVEKSDMGISLIPIKKYIKDRIQEEERDGDLERKERFLQRHL